uniref:Uncharacterized protein n=1 Tax=Anguilla anguilla TaxID=7936 RepID=A0A0E9XJG1_ANGAN
MSTLINCYKESDICIHFVSICIYSICLNWMAFLSTGIICSACKTHCLTMTCFVLYIVRVYTGKIRHQNLNLLDAVKDYMR